jgi:hypothetical protein
MFKVEEPAAGSSKSSITLASHLSIFFFVRWLEQLHTFTSQHSSSWPHSLKEYLQGGKELRRGCKDKSSAGLHKNDHNWQMHMLHHLGIVSCTL